MLKQGLEPNMITYRAVLNCSSRVHEAQLEFAFSWLDIMRENKVTPTGLARMRGDEGGRGGRAARGICRHSDQRIQHAAVAHDVGVQSPKRASSYLQIRLLCCSGRLDALHVGASNSVACLGSDLSTGCDHSTRLGSYILEACFSNLGRCNSRIKLLFGANKQYHIRLQALNTSF